MSLKELRSDLKKVADPKRAKLSQRFFKTGKGQYGEGDIFIGITVPDTRKIAVKYGDLSLTEIKELLRSEIHEERLCALHILVNNFNKYYSKRIEIFDFYMDNLKYVNNWDLVDTSAHYIIGQYLYHIGKEYHIYKILLTNLAKSSNLWERRIAIISTFYFIRNNDFSESLKISKMLLNDKKDLIHKAVGWMLREIGKKDLEVLESFLKVNYKIMPRTMLRYAIEKLPESKRLSYLKGKV